MDCFDVVGGCCGSGSGFVCLIIMRVSVLLRVSLACGATGGVGGCHVGGISVVYVCVVHRWRRW